MKNHGRALGPGAKGDIDDKTVGDHSDHPTPEPTPAPDTDEKE